MVNVIHIPFNPFVNENEKITTDFIQNKLKNLEDKSNWYIYSNIYLSSAITNNKPLEVDLLIVSNTGIHVIEVKYWDKSTLDDMESSIVNHQGLNIFKKARIIGSTFKTRTGHGPFVEGKFLFTKNNDEIFEKNNKRQEIESAKIYGLKEWKKLLCIGSRDILNDSQIQAFNRIFAKEYYITTSSCIKKFLNFDIIKHLKSINEPFHRVFQAIKNPSKDNVILHLYDLSAYRGSEDPREISEREANVLRKLQKLSCLPAIMDSYHEAPEYPGEMYYYSYNDYSSETLYKRTKDKSWEINDRINTCIKCYKCLKELHEFDNGDYLHRYLNPETIKIQSDGEPIFTQLQYMKLSDADTIANITIDNISNNENYNAPEILRGESCTRQTDIFSLTKCMLLLFEKHEKLKQFLGNVLSNYRKSDINKIIEELENFCKEKKTISKINASFWDEKTIKEMRGKHYKIIKRLDGGQYFHVFQVMQVDPDNERDIAGPFVAKVIKSKENNLLDNIHESYKKIKNVSGNYFVNRIVDISDSWEEDEICLLLKWFDGTPLIDLRGNLPSIIKGGDIEQAVIDYMIKLCISLTQLHKSGLVHGDIKPSNIILNKEQIHLIDLEAVNDNNSIPYFKTIKYCSKEVENNNIQLSDDIFCLASSFFEIIFDKPPFEDNKHKERGLWWDDREKHPRLYDFIQKATDPDIKQRFENSMSAIDYLSKLTKDNKLKKDAETGTKDLGTALEKRVNSWLYNILQSYPGSNLGNIETRGLDSDFAKKTYIETKLDEYIYRDIIERKVNLIILCGNAGDGKTALLQNLLKKMKIGNFNSKDRIINNNINGAELYVNLDGAASFGKRSSKELLDEFFAPFDNKGFENNIIRIIAINDGPLLNWLENEGSPWLSDQLLPRLFREDDADLDNRIKFVDLNDRSLVGESQGHNDQFLDTLIAKIIGSEDEWANCKSCIARDNCSAYFSYTRLKDENIGAIIRKRLLLALQAVHLKGEVHITAREIRATLIYIFFGTKFCRNIYFDKLEYFWDRAFDKTTRNRQGEVLKELLCFDPALESHPKIDRYLIQNQRNLSNISLESLRRKAFFEWSDEKLNKVADNQDTNVYPLSLAKTNYMRDFLDYEKYPESKKQGICRKVCAGISKLESIIHNEHDREDTIPLKISQYTPTETLFWVRKKIIKFQLYVPKAKQDYDIEYLHNHLILKYTYDNGSNELLHLNSDLFELLMSIEEGYQLSDMGSDESFANLSIFKQRLSQESQHELYAYNPANRDSIFRIFITKGPDGQLLKIAKEK